MQKSLTTIIQESREDLQKLLGARLSLWRLTAYEKGVPVGLGLGYKIVLALLGVVLFSLLLLTGGLALALPFAGEYLVAVRSVFYGFLILSGSVLFILLLLLLLRGRILRRGEEKILGRLLDKMDAADQNLPPTPRPSSETPERTEEMTSPATPSTNPTHIVYE